MTLGGFVCILAGGIETPVLPVFAEDRTHVGPFGIGVIVGALTLASMVVRPIAPRIVAVVGSARTLFGAAFVCGAVLATYPFVHSAVLLVLLRGVAGVGDGTFLVAGIAAACGVARRGEEAAATSTFTSVSALSLVVGPLIAAWLVSSSGFSVIWYVAASLAVTGGVMSAVVSRKATNDAPINRAPIRMHPAARRVGGRMFLAVLSVGAFFALAPLDAKRLGVSPALVMTIYGAVIFVARLGGATFVRRVNARFGLGAATAGVTLGSVILGFAVSPAVLLVGAAVLGAGVAFAMPFAIKVVLGAIPPNETVGSIGAMTAYFAAAQTAGAPLLGLCTRFGGYRGAFLVGASLSAASFGLQAFLPATRPHEGPAEDVSAARANSARLNAGPEERDRFDGRTSRHRAVSDIDPAAARTSTSDCVRLTGRAGARDPDGSVPMTINDPTTTVDPFVRLERALTWVIRVTRPKLHRPALRRTNVDPFDPAAYATLMWIHESGGCNPTTLADVLAVERSTASRQVISLEQDGLIERRRYPEDRRAYLLHLTEKGKSVLDEAREARSEELRVLLRSWDGHDIEQLTTALERFATLLRNSEVSESTPAAANAQHGIPDGRAADPADESASGEDEPWKPVGWEQWQWDESLFSGAAQYYARGRPPYAPGLAGSLANTLGLDGGGRLLDLGCGPGTITLELAHFFEEAVGLDPDQEMLAEGARLATDRNIKNAIWVCDRAESLPLGLGRFRLVTLAAAFHWMDRPRVAGTLRSMLDPGGAVVQVDAPGYRPADLAVEAQGRVLPYPPPPFAEMDALQKAYLGPHRRAGKGVRDTSPSSEDEVFQAAGFLPAETIIVPDQRMLDRHIDDLVAWSFSNSCTAPHLFGPQLAEFEKDLRSILRKASRSGKFSIRLPNNVLRIWRLPDPDVR